jgi:hypothetical protein
MPAKHQRRLSAEADVRRRRPRATAVSLDRSFAAFRPKIGDRHFAATADPHRRKLKRQQSFCGDRWCLERGRRLRQLWTPTRPPLGCLRAARTPPLTDERRHCQGAANVLRRKMRLSYGACAPYMTLGNTKETHDHDRAHCNVRLWAASRHHYRRALARLAVSLPGVPKTNRQRIRSSGALSCRGGANLRNVVCLGAHGRLGSQTHISLLPTLRIDRLLPA